MEYPAKKGKNNPPQTLRFVEPPYWDDEYERRFYTADYSKVDSDPMKTPRLFATCFATRRDSEPAWMVYDRAGKRCVQFCINQVALRTELARKLKGFFIVEGAVEYVNNYNLNTLHLSKDQDGESIDFYNQYFTDFSLEKYLHLLLLKRTAFEHEREIRVFIRRKNDKGKKSTTKEDAEHIDISLDWLSFLEGIKVDYKCTETEISLLQYHINKLIDKSTIRKERKEELRKKLIIEKYNVYEDIEGNSNLPIGETYKQFEGRIIQLHAHKKSEKLCRRKRHYKGQNWHREHISRRKQKRKSNIEIMKALK